MSRHTTAGARPRDPSEATYSIKELAELGGVSVRTLHHYDRIGLLVPERKSNGYRRYTARDVERLQLVLLYRACGMELSRIALMLDDPTLDTAAILRDQLSRLRAQRTALDQVIATAERTLASAEKGTNMDDGSRFEGLRQEAIEQNERTYGAEARRRWGNEAVDAANAALMAMDETEWNDMNALEDRIKDLLRTAMATGDATGPEAAALVRAHARWLSMHWGPNAYSAEAHRGLADGYLADDRFVAYYDGACGEGATTFLHDAIHALA